MQFKSAAMGAIRANLTTTDATLAFARMEPMPALRGLASRCHNFLTPVLLKRQPLFIPVVTKVQVTLMGATHAHA